MTEDEIAKAYGCSRSHVVKHVALMRDEYFIVNWGHGWYEFDAALCWRGPLSVRRAYIQVQRIRDGVTITGGLDHDHRGR